MNDVQRCLIVITAALLIIVGLQEETIATLQEEVRELAGVTLFHPTSTPTPPPATVLQ